MLLIIVSSGPLAGGHFQSLKGKNQRKDEPDGGFSPLLPPALDLDPTRDLLPVAKDHEQDQDQEQEDWEQGGGLCFDGRPL
jgi:hypothetical protein